MEFAHVRIANISHLRSKYFTAQLFHLPEGQISLKNPRLREDFSGLPDRIRRTADGRRYLQLSPDGEERGADRMARVWYFRRSAAKIRQVEYE